MLNTRRFLVTVNFPFTQLSLSFIQNTPYKTASYTVVAAVSWCSRYGKHEEVPPKSKIRAAIWSSNPTPEHTSGQTSKAEAAQSYPILCDPMDCSPPGSSVHGILQAVILEWVIIPFFRGYSPPRDWTCTAGRFFIIWATINQKDKCIPMFTAALIKAAKTWKQLKCPSADECIKRMWTYIHTHTIVY